jgi:acyl carrier protein
MSRAVDAQAEVEVEVEVTVCRLVAESLACDPARVTPAAGLMNDLGADSLDFLDIVFRLERVFDVQITRGEIEAAARGDLTEDEFAPGGVISERGLARLRALMPEAVARIQPGLHARQIMTLFTPATFANIVRRARERRPAAAGPSDAAQ